MNNTDDSDNAEDARDTAERLEQTPRSVPAFVRQRVLHLGQRGQRWLAELPEVVAQLERMWSITVGQALTGGTASYLAPARTKEGGGALPTIAIPEAGLAVRPRVLGSGE